MGLRSSSKAKRLTRTLALGALAFLSASCGNGDLDGVDGSARRGTFEPPDPCSTPQEGCDCDSPAEVVDCGTVQRRSGDQVWCSVGHRTCGPGGKWGACASEEVREINVPGGDQTAQALGNRGKCLADPCDPFCQVVVDDGADLDLPPGFQETVDGGITLTAIEGSINDTGCTSIELLPPEQSLTVTQLGAGGGLLGEYFDQSFADSGIPESESPAGTRLDPTIQFAWSGAPGVAGVGPDDFAVRWTGYLKAPLTGAYTLCATANDGVRLWLDEQLVVDRWQDQFATEHCMLTPSTLVANRLYEVRLEYYDKGDDGLAQLSWKHAGAPAGEAISTTSLVPPSGDGVGFVVSPPTAQFVVHALPDGCFAGPIRAAWTVDRLDRSQVDNFGEVALFAPVAGDIEVTAYVGNFSATGTVHVDVNVVDASTAPPGTAELFDDAPAGADTVTVLYPYQDTVFPLAIRPPLIQWDSGAVAADAVMVGLRHPATGTPTFSWSKIVPDVQPGRFTIPREIWSMFEASAKGNEAAYVVQRVTGGSLRPPVSRTLRFASAPVRGKIYYTQYARAGSASMMVADPASPVAAQNVFPDDPAGSDGHRCPVCHSVSANGTMFATSDRRFGGNGGLSRINGDGTFTPLSDYSPNYWPYRDGENDWRGFAWAPLTPDGSYALAANNIWGNTREGVVGIDAAARVVSVPQTMLSGGTGTGLLAKYFMNTGRTGWDWRRTDPKVDFNWGGASPGGPVPAAFSVVWSGQVQGYSNELYAFELQTTGGVRLTVGGNVLIDQLAHAGARATYVGTSALSKGGKTAILIEFADNAANAEVYLRWSSPSVPYGFIPQTQLYPDDGWHGLLANYYNENDFTNLLVSQRLESDLEAYWGNESPSIDIDGDYWSATFTGRIQAPGTGDLAICASADDGVTVAVGGVTRIDQVGVSDGCSVPFAVTEGAYYDLAVQFREDTGDARLSLSWQMSGATSFAREVVPSARLSPPAAWAPPTHGLTAAYYDTEDFNKTIGTGAGAGAFTRIEENADLTWGDLRRPAYSSAITDKNHFSSRLTGQLEAPCSGIFEFEVFGDDGGRFWLNDTRVVDLWDYGTRQGALWLDAGQRYDLKLDHKEGWGGAHVNLRWKVLCAGDTNFTPVPSANLYPSGDAGTAGYLRDGGDNGNGHSYFVWRTPATTGDVSVDVTDASAGRWGLGSNVMMVPSFAPDASKLVFIDGDSGGGAGWRKGLSTFSFDQAARVFKDRKSIVNTWPAGDVMKWPVFESDSRSVIYQATVPADVCCRKGDWTKYGQMAPTNYYEDPGRLFSVDTEAVAPAPVELTRLNQGERPTDRNKAYQATMLPQAAAGYRWAVFTSTRPYGNTLNLTSQQDYSNTANYAPMLDYTKIQSMLWVAAVDDSPSGGTDRSHPAFFLPNQNYDENPAVGFVNERAYWVAEACRPVGAGPGSSCEVDEDCCGGVAKTAVCRIDAPAQIPPTRHCAAVPNANTCVPQGMACGSSDECCVGSVCDDGLCVKPPAFAKFEPANFERVYEANCAAGQKVEWTLFEYKASVPAVGGKLEFFVESADLVSGFQTLPVAPAAVTTPGVAMIGAENSPGAPNVWTPKPLKAALQAAAVVSRKFLKLTIRFIPNQTGVASPILTDWRQSFSCPPGE